MKTAFVAALAAVIVSSLPLPLCRFAEEQITIDVWPQEVRVHGVYRYENPLPFAIHQGLRIPLPVDSDHPEPYALVVQNSIARRLFGSYACEVELGARSATVLELEYRQFAPRHNARYLLTTTRPWRLPLRRGVYRIVPHGVTIDRSNFPLAFVRTNFMPEHDWEFSWQ